MAHRRYSPIGTEPIYDAAYDNGKARSPILNPRQAQRMSVMDFQDIFSKRGLETTLLRWNQYKEAAEAGLAEIDAAFERYRQKRANEGFPRPREMTKEMKEKRLQAEAKLDILKDEIAELEKRLKKFTDEETKQSDGKVLKNGPRGSGKLRDGVLVEVDGQRVEADENGVLRIRDARSPYDGITTADYFEKVVQVWKSETARLQKEFNKKVAEGEIDPRVTKKPRAPRPPCPEIEKQEEANATA